MGERMQDDQLEVGELDGRGEKLPNPPTENRKKRLQRKPTAFERRVEERVTRNVAADLEERHALTETGVQPPAEAAPVSGPEPTQSESPFAQALRLLQEIASPGSSARNDGGDESAKRSQLPVTPQALRLLADLTEEIASPSSSARNDTVDQAANASSSPRQLAQGGAPAPAAKASHIIQPSGGGLPVPDLRGEYEKRLAALRPGDVAGLMEIKREYRKRGLEVY